MELYPRSGFSGQVQRLQGQPHRKSHFSYLFSLPPIQTQTYTNPIPSNSPKGPYGENVYWVWFSPATTVPNFTTYTEKAFDAWVSTAEINAYKAGDLLGGGHFTQSVWKASKKIGCAWSTTRCTQNKNQEWFFTCEYDPRGNIIGYYPGNATVV